MYARVFLLVCLFTGLLDLSGQTVFTLKDLQEKKITLNETFTGKARVYVFLSPECPLCQGYSLTLRNLYEQYHKKGIEVIGIVPGTDFTTAQIAAYQKEYKIPFVLLKDENMQVVKKYRAEITPEAVVTDGKGKVLYQGRIDNWAYEVGRKRKIITEHDLENALESIATNKPVKVTKTKAVGCFIE